MSNQKSNIKLETQLSIAALVAGIISLLFSWRANQIASQANQIASQQISAHIAVIDESNIGGTISNDQAVCKHRIRITNLGGASTALVSYQLKILYKDQVLYFENSEAFVANGAKVGSEFENFRAVLLNKDAPVDFPSLLDQSNWLTLPVEIDPFGTLDIDISLAFNVDPTHDLKLAGNPNTIHYIGYSPMQVTYTLKFASNQILEVPSINCISAKD